FQLGACPSFKVTSSDATPALQTMLHAAVGLGVPLRTPVVSIEPFVSPWIRYHHYSNVAPGAPDHEVHFAWVIGGNVGVGPIGIHVAYDSEKFDDGTTHGVFGIGANLGLRP